ncbi:MAG: aminotransferase class III-fold pyridoxal phosphate-dependent enzyme [Kofleriaceae bacterium]|nr:aminotransferase class III-fold pyridoxal phosphate-dependent enzyme [Kofleriaceae bacterium]MBP9166876.1 aminotransferase class III-fold pyridoxal phosphate-dependent enzyme [Kofleriaceae bacterium]MBP9860007.1 aminotransferase class III-fold pyridoxal phosphate-dependent enzyme [Kofleriaceae bacterium]
MTQPSLTAAEADAIVAKDEQYIMRPWTHPKGEPVIVARAKGCVVTDVHGKDYLDFTAGYFVNNAGHCHPRVVEAATAQLHRVLQVSGKHGTIPAIQLAERLVNLLPPSIDQAFFSTGGSEANEFALKMARQASGKPDVAYLENAYHGLTLGALEVTASEKYRESAGRPVGGHSYTVPNAYCYRCKFGPAATCNVECLDGVAAQFAARPTGALLAEPIQSVGGLAPPAKWWERMDALRKQHGLLLIIDEVQTGLGRTGKMFGLEHYGLEPEIVSGGKGLSGGVGSLAMTCAGKDVIAKFFGGTTPTSGGNAVSAAAGLALIETIIDEGMIANAAAMGRYFTDAAWALGDPWIGDVRFTGLLGGIELVTDRAAKTVPPKAALAAIKDRLHDAGMLITMSGTFGNVLRLQPPLPIAAAQIDTFLATLREVLTAVRAS